MAPFKASRAEWDTRSDESTRGYKTPFMAGNIFNVIHGPRDNVVTWIIGIWEKYGLRCHVPIFTLNVNDSAKLDGDHGTVTMESLYRKLHLLILLSLTDTVKVILGIPGNPNAIRTICPRRRLR